MDACDLHEQLMTGQSRGMRDKQLEKLESGYKAFKELEHNITEGEKVSHHKRPLCFDNNKSCVFPFTVL